MYINTTTGSELQIDNLKHCGNKTVCPLWMSADTGQHLKISFKLFDVFVFQSQEHSSCKYAGVVTHLKPEERPQMTFVQVCKSYQHFYRHRNAYSKNNSAIVVFYFHTPYVTHHNVSLMVSTTNYIQFINNFLYKIFVPSEIWTHFYIHTPYFLHFQI